jgi:hypothetical protein
MPDSELFEGAKALSKSLHVKVYFDAAQSSLTRKRVRGLTSKVRFFISFFEFRPLQRKKNRSVSKKMKNL